MKKNLLRTGLLVVCTLAFSVTNAQSELSKEPKEKKDKKFGLADTDNDGKISQEEYNAFRTAQKEKKGKEVKKEQFTKRFKQIDTNQDGFISKEEFKNRKETRVKEDK